MKKTYLKIAIALLICTGIYFGVSKPEEKTVSMSSITSSPLVQQHDSEQENLIFITGDYISQHESNGTSGDWWLINSGNEVDMCRKYKSILEDKVKLIRVELAKYSDLNALTKRISENFKQITPSLLLSPAGPSKICSAGIIDTVGMAQSLEICFVPQDVVFHVAAHMIYDRDRGHVLLIYGLNTPASIWGALMYHELGHALHDRTGDPAATAAWDSDANYFEEATMHQLESEVLNSYSKGLLYRKIDSVILAIKPENISKLFKSLTTPDLVMLDPILEISSTDYMASNHLSLHYLIMYGERYYASIGDNSEASQISLYKKIKGLVRERPQN